MAHARRLLAAPGPAALLLAAVLAARSDARPPAAGLEVRALARSHQLWSSINVCNPPDQRNTVGVRGSMPGDGRSGDTLYMRFRLQQVSEKGTWVDLAGAASGFIRIGSAKLGLESGRSFILMPGSPPLTVRGVVTFQWRRGRAVLATLSRPTTAAHKGLKGADPKNFSAALCQIR
jgi:hypothetical protein